MTEPTQHDCGSNNQVAFTGEAWRNAYTLDRIRWGGFLHPPTGIGMILDLTAADGLLPNDDPGLEHTWDDGERGCLLGGSWLIATPGSTPRSFDQLADQPHIVDHPDEPTSTWIKDLAAVSRPYVDHQDPGTCGNLERDNSFGLYWQSHHAGSHSHRISFEPCPEPGNRRLHWTGVMGTWIGDREGNWSLEDGPKFVVDACVPFEGFDLTQGLTDDEARVFLDSVLADSDEFELVEAERTEYMATRFGKRFVPRPG